MKKVPVELAGIIPDFGKFSGMRTTEIDRNQKIEAFKILLFRVEMLCWKMAIDHKTDTLQGIVGYLTKVKKVHRDPFLPFLEETIARVYHGLNILEKRYEVHPVMNLNGVVTILMELSVKENRAQVLYLLIPGTDLTRTEYLLGELRNAGLVEEKKDVAGQPHFAITETGRNQLEMMMVTK